MLDSIDNHLLDLLQRNARLPYAELGKEVGLSVSAVNERLKKLDAQGYIEHYTVRINAAQAGFDVCAFIHVLLSTPEHEGGFLQRVLALEEIQECHHITGEFSYLLKVRVRSTADLELFLKQGLKSIPGIARTNTAIALSSPKETSNLSILQNKNTL